MGKATKVKRRKMSYDEALAELPRLSAELDAAASVYASRSRDVLAPYRAALDALRLAEAQLAEIAAPVSALRVRMAAVKKLVDAGPGASPIVLIEVDNPLRADELVAEQLAEGAEKPSNRIKVDIRMSALIGGLSRVQGVSDFQRAAAGRFRSLWELSQIGGARAIDYAAARVDVSGAPSSDAMLTAGEDARREYAAAVQRLGMVRSNLVERVVCSELGIRELARQLGRPDGGKARQALLSEVLEAVDELVSFFRIGPAQGRARIVADAGDRLPLPAVRTEIHFVAEEGTKAA